MKSQSSIEFMMNYGWMILLVAVIGFLLFRLGVFDAENFMGLITTGIPSFHVEDAGIYQEGNLTLFIAYKAQDYAVISKIDYEVEGFNCSISQEINQTIRKDLIEIKINPLNSCNIDSKNAKISITIYYTPKNKLDKTETGKIRLTVIKNQSQIIEPETELQISNVANSSITNESAIISWNTNKLANSSVIFGQTVAMNEGSNSSSNLALSHYLIINNLLPETNYYYNITSCNESCLTRGPYNFETLHTSGNFSFLTSSEEDFNKGQYINTTFGSVKLSGTNLTGSYYSKVFNTNNSAEWDSISWNQELAYKKELENQDNLVLLYHLNELIMELPNNNSIKNSINMSSNLLLLHFNEVSGNILDYSGKNNNPTIVNATYGASGKFNTALLFNGINNSVTIPNSASMVFGNGMTLMAWVKASSQLTSKIFEKGDWNGHSLYQDLWTGWKATFRINGSSYSMDWLNGQPELNKWYHLAATFNGSKITLYVNGAEKNSQSINGYLSSNNNPVIIGATSNQKYFNGTIDEASLFNRSLSAAEIFNIYRLSNEIINDSSSFNNNGLISGGLVNNPSYIFNNSMLFDGIDDYIRINNSNSFNFTKNMSINAWIKISSIGSGGTIIFKNVAFLSRVENTGSVSFILYNPSYNSLNIDWDDRIQDTNWHLITSTYDNNEMRIYIDGVLKKSKIANGSISYNSNELRIGNQGSINYFNGSIDEISLWNKTLSSDEILNFYKKGILNLNLSVRSCDDSACSGEPWINAYNDSFNSILSVADNQYFQYKFDFETLNSTYSPILHNVTVNYEIE